MRSLHFEIHLTEKLPFPPRLRLRLIMPTAQAYLPARPYAARRGALGKGAIALLSLAVAACCAATVFAFLYNFDQPSPIAAIYDVSSPAPFSGATTTQDKPASNEATAVASQAPPSRWPIARSHAELIALERLGGRNYVEFRMSRTASFQPVGPIQIGLWRLDTRHSAAQLSILIGRRRVDYKRVTAGDRVLVPNGSQPFELVVNRVTRKQISGYVSEPVAR